MLRQIGWQESWDEHTLPLEILKQVIYTKKQAHNTSYMAHKMKY